MNFTNFHSPLGKGSKEVGHPFLQVWFFTLRENVQTQGCPQPSTWWARSAWLSSTCHFMWALCPQVRRGPLPGPGLESRVSWHSSWMSQCSLPAKRELLSWTHSSVSSTSVMSWLDLENSDTASHTHLVHTRTGSPEWGAGRGRLAPPSLFIHPHLILLPGYLCFYFIIFTCLFLAALGLGCYMGLSLVAVSGGYLLVAALSLLVALVSLVAKLRL